MGKDSGRLTPLRSLASFASAVLLVLALSFFIAWPLWSLAVKERRVFTIAVGACAVLAAIFFIARPMIARAAHRRAIRRHEGL
jgi:hypothetical protein